eukprot:920993-Pelagomonas_calceolata.AAC.1
MKEKAVEKQALSSTEQPGASWSPENNVIQIQKVAGVSSEQLERYALLCAAHTLQNWCTPTSSWWRAFKALLSQCAPFSFIDVRRVSSAYV